MQDRLRVAFIRQKHQLDPFSRFDSTPICDRDIDGHEVIA